jgi:Fe-S oxidoreductase
MDADPNGRDGTLAAFVSDEAIWSCTTCGACTQACPVGIEVFEKILEVRRGRVESGAVPAAAHDLFERTAEHFNPMNRPSQERLAWAAGLDVPVAAPGEPIDTLYWVGCAGSFDPDGRSVSRAMVRILNRMGVSYRTLGLRERCTGDPARRMGEEGLFQELARENIRTATEHGVRRIVTHCPHCYNTWKHEYSQLGAQVEVEHHTEFLARAMKEGRLSVPDAGSRTLTLHDPCYLGRMNGQTRAPRDVIAGFPSTSLVEMPRHGERSFCCGAGGGSMWLDQPGRTRVEAIRAHEASGTGATTVATACPFCKSMLRAGAQTLGSAATLEVKDLAELVVEANGW